ncbi:tetratricopeptide repeat-containing sensor histidine kinase [Arcticibacter eurypsychrophilus]|uniref:tetratricopeptide repeat-containing sensor histidine kinase n=1 Tax=Arcticibacter eurypsychrophilus TaxID=1434752 RepID=UPI00084D760B|nr:ATP-binding protein [Arcticibacter eurypsychrophilus]
MIKEYFKPIIFSICCLTVLNCSAGTDMAKYPKANSVIIKTIDSLNDLAFKVKRNNITRALDILYQSSYLAENNNYENGIATALLTEAGIYQQNGYFKRALTLYYKSLNISAKNGDSMNIARANQQIGSISMESGNYREAERQTIIAMKYFTLLSKKEDIINMKNSLGSILMNQGNQVAAMNYFNAALLDASKIHYEYGIKKACYNIGLVNSSTGMFNNAKIYFLRALAFDIKNKDNYGIALVKNQLAIIAIKMKDYATAENLLESSIVASRSISAAQLEIDAVSSLCLIYKEQKKLEKVIEWQQVLIQRHQKLLEKEKVYAMNFMEILREKEQERFLFQKKILKGQQDAKYVSMILGVVGLGLVIFIVVVLLWYKNYIKIKAYSKELMSSNIVIQSHILSLKTLNQEISGQNSSLEESNKMKDKLLSIISHDLRQPLANTKGILDLIDGDYLSVDEMNQLLKDLDTQYVRSLTLLDNLLFWIKSQMAGQKIESKLINLRILINEISHELEISASKKGITIINDIQDRVNISGDLEMMKVVFRNLISNSIKFTEKGFVKIYVTEGAELCVHVHDSGVGMTDEALKKVLSKNYFTTRGTHKESGSGFGLLICKDLISKHGGKMEVKSEINKGTEFTIFLSNVIKP